MPQKDEKLLLKDLCARLPYGVILDVDTTDWKEPQGHIKVKIEDLGILCKDMSLIVNGSYYGKKYKPYLRPMSSMTEEEREDFWKNVLDIDWRELEFDEEPDEVPFPFTENDCGFYLDNLYLADLFAVIDWLNEHHFDYRGLIPKGLAIEVTKDNNPYKEIVL